MYTHFVVFNDSIYSQLKKKKRREQEKNNKIYIYLDGQAERVGGILCCGGRGGIDCIADVRANSLPRVFWLLHFPSLSLSLFLILPIKKTKNYSPCCCCCCCMGVDISVETTTTTTTTGTIDPFCRTKYFLGFGAAVSLICA